MPDMTRLSQALPVPSLALAPGLSWAQPGLLWELRKIPILGRLSVRHQGTRQLRWTLRPLGPLSEGCLFVPWPWEAQVQC